VRLQSNTKVFPNRIKTFGAASSSKDVAPIGLLWSYALSEVYVSKSVPCRLVGVHADLRGYLVAAVLHHHDILAAGHAD